MADIPYPQKYEALVDTGVQCSPMPLSHEGTESIDDVSVVMGRFPRVDCVGG